MDSTRRLVVTAALGIALIALAGASDFVFGSFWAGHAMVTSLLAALLVLAVTVAVLNETLDRRDRRRWSVLAQYVLFQLVQAARATWMELVELVEQHKIESGSPEGLASAAALARDSASFAVATSAMLLDPKRRRILQEVMVAIAAHSRTVVVNWAAVMVGAGPYTEVFDRHVELQGHLDWISDILSHNEPTEHRTVAQTHLTRSSVAAEHATAFGSDDWLCEQIVITAELAVRLDYESRALGFRLVPMEWWADRSGRVAREYAGLSG